MKKTSVEKENKKSLPSFLRPFFWSYDFSKLDVQKHKKLIIKNILNYGSLEALAWLGKNFSEKEIKKSIENSYASEWNKKSLNLWSFFWKVEPKKNKRF